MYTRKHHLNLLILLGLWENNLSARRQSEYGANKFAPYGRARGPRYPWGVFEKDVEVY